MQRQNTEYLGLSDHIIDALIDSPTLQTSLLSILKDDRILGWSPQVMGAIGSPQLAIGGGFSVYSNRPYPVLHLSYRGERARILQPENVHLLDQLMMKLKQVTGIEEVRVWDNDQMVNVWWDGYESQVAV